jgi:preprotein translocase subunit SecY
MFETIKNAWKIPELRKKILFTLLVIVVFRIGAAITVPFLSASALSKVMSGSGSTLMGYLDIMTGGAFSKATIFSMSVTPYINASIIIQLLGVAIPSLERMQKEGEVGRKKIAQITRYTTIGLGLLQGFFYYLFLNGSGVVMYNTGFQGVWAAITIVLEFCAGTALMMWLGEQINDKGVGNGISVLLFAGIISRVPTTVAALAHYASLYTINKIITFAIVIAVLALVAAIVFMTDAERRIPVQYAKRVVGRKMFGGQSSFIPLKVTMSGVMPIIFAMSIVSVPTLIGQFLNQKSLAYTILFKWFGYTSFAYAALYLLLIIGFNYFYVAIQYNPNEIANNLRKNNGGIPGIRPGKPTADFIKHCLNRITLIGALFLGLVAVMPIFLSHFVSGMALGGTTLLIVVGVAIDTSRQLESQMMMRHYKGFLE